MTASVYVLRLLLRARNLVIWVTLPTTIMYLGELGPCVKVSHVPGSLANTDIV